MSKGNDFFAGASRIADSNTANVHSNKGGIIVSGAVPSMHGNMSTNGLYAEPRASMDLYMSVDDAGGAVWNSRVGTYFANRNGTPNVTVETPLYPFGGFAGIGYRNSMLTTDTDNYVLPADPSHDLTASSVTSYDVTFMTHDFVDDEIILCNGSALDYNFYIAAISILGNPYIELRVRCATGDAVIQSPCERSAWYKILMVYQGASNSLSLAINGKLVSLSNGVGSPNVGGTFGLGIGTGPLGSSAEKVRILEVIRYQENMLLGSEWFNRCTHFFGLKTNQGQYPTAYGRPTRAAMYVNNKMWQFSADWMRVREYGYLEEGTLVNVLMNSTFTDALNTGHTVYGGALTTYQADADANNEVGGTGLRVDNDAIGTAAGAYWASAFVGASAVCHFSIEWKSLDLGAQAYYQIYNLSTGNYYNESTQSWQATFIENPAGSPSASKVKYDLFFTNDTSASVMFIALSNGAVINGGSVIFFHTQLMPGYDVHGSPFIYESLSATTQKSNDVLNYDGVSSIDYSNGSVDFDLTVQNSSTENTTGADLSYFGGLGKIIYRPLGSSDVWLTDGTNTASVALAYPRDYTMRVAARWGTALTLAERNTGTVGTTTFTPPLSSGDVSIGGDTATNINQGYAYIKNLRIIK